MKYVFFLISLFILFQSKHKPSSDPQNTILIEHNNSEIRVDGNIEEPVWDNATTVVNLFAPWDKSAVDSTIFRCFFSTEYFNFCYEVFDESVVLLDYIDEMSIAKGDRVELFLSSSLELSPYYCLEINPMGQVLDYEAYFYRKFDYSWNFNNLSVRGRVTENGYIVEGRLPIYELYKLDLDLKNGFYLGVYRADFTEEKESSAIWYSLVDPKVEKADFHLPSAFKKCKMKNR